VHWQDIGFCVTCCKQRWHLGITYPSSFCPSVCLSVCPCVKLYLSTDASEIKLHIWIELGGQEPCTISITLASIFLELYPFVNFLKELGRWHMCSMEHPILVFFQHDENRYYAFYENIAVKEGSCLGYRNITKIYTYTCRLYSLNNGFVLKT